MMVWNEAFHVSSATKQPTEKKITGGKALLFPSLVSVNWVMNYDAALSGKMSKTGYFPGDCSLNRSRCFFWSCIPAGVHSFIVPGLLFFVELPS
jgi:hypothetical protein